MKKRLVIGISGASGIQLAIAILKLLKQENDWESHLVCTEGARRVLECETSMTYQELAALADEVYNISDIGAAVASGTFRTEGMVVAPCSMKTLAGIAHSFSENLLMRAADVTLKERRRLVLLTRETPLHLGHLRNMTAAAEIGAVIMPPVLTYYSGPGQISDMEHHIACKVLNIFNIEPKGFRRWKGG